MFFPLRDENPTERAPFVNYALIALNVAAFVFTARGVEAGEWWLLPGYGLVPTRIALDPAGEAFTIVTSMFMHGDFWHLASNVIFLHIFGDNLEDVMGHVRYLAFYLLCGLAAALTQVGVDLASPIPMVGASGAIAGVVGGYLLLFPKAPIIMLNLTPLVLLIGFLPVVPAWLVAGEFFVVNVAQALREFGEDIKGGVAVYAHLGGFIAGFVLTRPALARRKTPTTRKWQSFRRAPVSGAPPAAASGARWRRRPRRPSD